MARPLIPINTATAEEIAALYDVGPTLAERIVSFREVHGPFTGPHDLSQVEGISRKLAITLSPHIDWEVPVTPKQLIKGVWKVAILAVILFGLVPLLWSLVSGLDTTLAQLRYSLSRFQAGFSEHWVALWIAASGWIITPALSLLCTTLMLVSVLTRNHAQVGRLRRAVLLVMALGVLVTVSQYLVLSVWYQFYAPNGWVELIERPQQLFRLIEVFVVGTFLLGPLLLTWWRPELFKSVWLARCVDAALMGTLALVAWRIWRWRGSAPMWILAYYGLWGLLIPWIGLATLRSGRSLFQEQVKFWLGPALLARLGVDSAGWQAWINARLPDPEQQQAVQRALNETYPPSRARTLSGLIVIGAGGWLVTSVLAAIIEWLVQGWLKQWF